MIQKMKRKEKKRRPNQSLLPQEITTVVYTDGGVIRYSIYISKQDANLDRTTYQCHLPNKPPPALPMQKRQTLHIIITEYKFESFDSLSLSLHNQQLTINRMLYISSLKTCVKCFFTGPLMWKFGPIYYHILYYIHTHSFGNLVQSYQRPLLLLFVN